VRRIAPDGPVREARNRVGLHDYDRYALPYPRRAAPVPRNITTQGKYLPSARARSSIRAACQNAERQFAERRQRLPEANAIIKTGRSRSTRWENSPRVPASLPCRRSTPTKAHPDDLRARSFARQPARAGSHMASSAPAGHHECVRQTHHPSFSLTPQQTFPRKPACSGANCRQKLIMGSVKTFGWSNANPPRSC